MCCVARVSGEDVALLQASHHRLLLDVDLHAAAAAVSTVSMPPAAAHLFVHVVCVCHHTSQLLLADCGAQVDAGIWVAGSQWRAARVVPCSSQQAKLQPWPSAPDHRTACNVRCCAARGGSWVGAQAS